MAEVLTVRSHGSTAVEETWQRFVPSARLHRAPSQPLDFTWASVTLPGFSVVRYDLAASVRCTIEPTDQILACRVAARDYWAGTRGRELDPRLPWVSIDGPTAARWHGRGRVRAFVLDRALTEELAGTLVGPRRFTLRGENGSALSPHLATHWERVFDHVAGGLLDPGAPASPIIEAELCRHAMHATLAVFFPDVAEALEQTPQRSAAPRVVRLAVAFIDEHAHEPVTVDDVAAAAGISPRGLQYAFRRAMDSTPTAYLRMARLAGAHDDLRTDPAAAIGEIARRWGYGSASRFARHYREVYGVSPRETHRGTVESG
jgi:AraC-like DNA-binding protein